MKNLTELESPIETIDLDTHNIMDYVIGGSLMAAPYVFGFSNNRAARNTFMTLGSGLIGYSLITRYRYSIAKVMPVSTHMKMDVASGLTLMAAPWTFGYWKNLNIMGHVAHGIFGLGALLLVAVTRGGLRQAAEMPSIEGLQTKLREASTRVREAGSRAAEAA